MNRYLTSKINIFFVILLVIIVMLYVFSNNYVPLDYSNEFITKDNNHKIGGIDTNIICKDAPILDDYYSGIEEKTIISDTAAIEIANAVIYTNICDGIEYSLFIKGVKNKIRVTSDNNGNILFEIKITAKQFFDPLYVGSVNNILGKDEYKVYINSGNAEITKVIINNKNYDFIIYEETAVRIATALFKTTLKKNSLSNNILKFSKEYMKKEYEKDTISILTRKVLIDDNNIYIDVYEVQRKLKYISSSNIDELTRLTYKYNELKTLIRIDSGKCLKVWR